MEQVQLTSLIYDFIDSVKRGDTHLIKSRKFNLLTKFLGPMDLEGLREAWAYYDSPSTDVFPYAFDDTIRFLVKQYEGVKVNLPE